MKISIGKKLADLSYHTMDEIDRLIFIVNKLAETWSRSDLMQAVLENDPHGAISKALENIATTHGIFGAILCYDVHGKVIASSLPEFIGWEAEDKVSFQNALKQKNTINYSFKYFKPLEADTLEIVFPIFNHADPDKIIGLLSFHLNWSEIFDIANDVRISGEGASSYAVLTDREGKLIAGTGTMSDPEYLFKYNLHSLGMKSIDLALQGKSGFAIERDLKGEKWLIGYCGSQGFREFKGTGWSVFVFVRSREAFASVKNLAYQLAGFSILVSIFVAFIGMVFARRITRPLRELTETAQEIGHGNFSKRVNVESKDEVEDLGHAFNNMTEKVQDYVGQLSSSRSRLQNILDSASDAIISVDENQKIILFNNQAERIFRYKNEEVLGQPLEMLMPERFREKHRLHVKQFGEGEVSFRMIGEHHGALFGLRKSGEEFPCEITISKTIVEGKLIFTAVLRDVTEKQKLENMLLQSEKMSAVGQLAAGVAHEINNPLGIILGFSQGLVKRMQPKDPLEMPLKSIEREALRCKTLVQSLLTFSRVEKTGKDEINLNQAIDGALTLIFPQGRVTNVLIEKRLDETIPKIVANQNQIQQVMINLCNNAIDAMPQGGKVIVSTRKVLFQGNNWIAIDVEDNGAGIPPAVLPEIFNPFFTTKEVGKGTGLGLSLVHEIIERHGGRIDVQSEVGKGTVFQVLLPIVAI
ncbi:MAG: PAS domain S-box protein [Candidatus Omnitrophica bacterium]|nr:PAS domain S-box protein [Candidatus Omnitrophota bacterium]